MKINWGTAIAIFYTCFVLAMVLMVVKSSQNKMDLVQENYYQKDLDYENFRSKRQNAKQLSQAISIQYSLSENAIELSFPQEMQALKGTLTLFRPANKTLDQTFVLKLNQEAKMSIPVDQNIPAGLWRVQIDWESKGDHYFKEESISI